MFKELSKEEALEHIHLTMDHNKHFSNLDKTLAKLLSQRYRYVANVYDLLIDAEFYKSGGSLHNILTWCRSNLDCYIIDSHIYLTSQDDCSHFILRWL